MLDNDNGNLSQDEIDAINANLAKKGIPTEAGELINNVDLLIPESRQPGKFVSDINK